ncbi:MAG: hypothetical protein ACYS8W_08250 [Planctomycetota bacterium]|jgi:hypothetical protein
MNARNIIGVIVLLALASGGLRYILKASPEKQLAREISAMNKKCPMMIDEETRLDRLSSGPGMRVEYFYTVINYSKHDFEPGEFEATVKAMLLQNMQNNRELDKFRKFNVTFVHNYVDMSGDHLARIEVMLSEKGK